MPDNLPRSLLTRLNLPPLPTMGTKAVYAGLPQPFEAFALAHIMAQSQCHIHIAADTNQLKDLQKQLQHLCPDIQIMVFPEWDCLPYDRVSPSKQCMGERLLTLTHLMNTHSQAYLILTTGAAFLQRSIPQIHFQAQNYTLKSGQVLNQVTFVETLVALGYRRTETVREPAEFSLRGGIIDLFPVGVDNPVRLDLFGDDIESIKAFDPLSQRSLDAIDCVNIHPSSEILLNDQNIRQFRLKFRELFPKNVDQNPLYQAISHGKSYAGMEHWLPLFHDTLGQLLDYAPPTVTLSLGVNAQAAMLNRIDQVQEYYQARLDYQHHNKMDDHLVYQPVAPELLYVQAHEIDGLLVRTGLIQFNAYQTPDADIDLHVRPHIDFKSQANKTTNSIEFVIKTLREYCEQGRHVVIAAETAGTVDRLAGLLREHQFFKFNNVDSWSQVFLSEQIKVHLLIFPLNHGFVGPQFVVITDQDIFGPRYSRATQRRRRSDLFISETTALEIGDYVVHNEHGISRYEGLHTLQVNQLAHDCLCLIYDGGDKLFLPVENMELITRYGGQDSQAVLDRLGSAAWQSRKARVKKKLLDIAAHLLKIAAERQLQQGDVFDVATDPYQEFIARFPYNETDDQLRAIEETFADLGQGRPMDRLICGDVGFGKTEIALRAAFIVASQGKQVAMIAPTTLLCAQHYRQFVNRFDGFGLRLGQLSRLVPASAQKLTKAALANGELDLVVGTHGLLSPSTKFNNLGLVIVDEEQHFGVKQKERLKENREDVHFLTLSATPIPRTLQMALTGVKDMSIIATPPLDRLAVKTFVMVYDPVMIREAIMRERFRGGQIFYVCPRIEDLDYVAGELKHLIPDIKVAKIHGQMPAADIENIMLSFYKQEFELLLSTNIIESGLDLPTVNTIIIHRADLFGLSQLYQLRGRVGRAKLRGYAYLTIPNNKTISTDAHKRLQVMQTLETLGSGFQLASHDMDIRGTGNLLGAEQSGHIREVGVELYQQMLEETINEIQSQRQDPSQPIATLDWTPQINIAIPVLIPEIYVADLGVRLSLYRRLSQLNDDNDAADFREELIDRFGTLPPEVINLLEIMQLKRWCRTANIEKIDTGDKGAVISFYQNNFQHAPALLQYVQRQRGAVFIRPDQKLVFLRPWHTIIARQQGLRQIIQELVKLATP